MQDTNNSVWLAKSQVAKCVRRKVSLSNLVQPFPTTYFRYAPTTTPTTGASGFFIDSRQSPGQPGWSYGEQENWAEIGHKECAKNAQSPIDIQNKNVIPNNQLKIHLYNYDQPTKFKLQNAHHTIRMSPLDVQNSQGQLNARQSNDYASNAPLADIMTADEDEHEYHLKAAESANHHQQNSNKSSTGASRIRPPANTLLGRREGANDIHLDESSQQQNQAQPPYGGVPTIKLDWLDDGNNEYKLKEIHFHWAERRDNGSEHAIDGRRAAMEVSATHSSIICQQQFHFATPKIMFDDNTSLSDTPTN